MSREDEEVIQWLGNVVAAMGATVLLLFAVIGLFVAVAGDPAHEHPAYERALIAFGSCVGGVLATRLFHQTVRRGPA